MTKHPNTSLEVNAKTTQLAQMLAGVAHSHIGLIEDAYDVTIHDRSPLFQVTGAAENIQAAQRVMMELIAMAQTRDIEISDVRGVINHAGLEGRPMGEIKTPKKRILAKTLLQSEYIAQIAKNDLTFGIGPAGTGKTFLGAAYAISMLENKMVERIILTRPAVEAGERLGFLPGDMKEKVDPYMRPIYDALNYMVGPEKVEDYTTKGMIEIAPLAFMRGRTLYNAAVLVDEAQNTTTMQMKMILTRIGEKSKMIVTGDPTQIDLPPSQKSGLLEAVSILDGVSGVGIVRFGEADVVRHALVGRIVKAYDQHRKNLIRSPDA